MAIFKGDAHQQEALKTDAERAEDVAYTINHALACSTTDFIDPVFQKLTQDWIGHRIKIGCGNEAHDHNHQFNPKGSWWHSIGGEIAGDFGSVPIAIAFQRFTPGLMAGLRNFSESLVGDIFHRSAEQSAARWAFKRGIAYNSKAYHQRMEEIYQHEMGHLPQAIIWTLSSIGLNTATQRLTGNTHSPVIIAGSKAVGSLITTGIVIGARVIAPRAAREWDKYTSKNLFLPATKYMANLFGIKNEVVDKVVKREEAGRESTWTEQIRQDPLIQGSQTPER